MLLRVIIATIYLFYAGGQEMLSLEERVLRAPDLSDENFVGAKVGIRPCRLSGPRVEKEYLNHKVIIHNYGYGGSGLTLCWGGAQRSADLLSEALMKEPSLAESNKIAVLGAGVIGLSTAHELLKLGYDVTIYADKFSPHLTSDIAAGIWSPPSLKSIQSEEKKKVMERMLEVSRERYLQLATSNHPELLGVGLIDLYSFKDQYFKEINCFESDFDNDKRDVSVQFDNGLRKSGTVKKILSIDGKKFLKDLFNKVKRLGATVVQHRIENVQDVVDLEENIVVNCTSFGSEKIFNDQEFLPTRGHILIFKNVNHLEYMASENVHDATTTWVAIYPRGDELIICGTLEEGIREESVDPRVVQEMLKNTRSRFSPKRLIEE